MADGKVSILVDVDGKQVKVLNEELDRVVQKGKQGSSALKDFAIGAGAFKVASAAVDVLKQSIDKAISRFDTLEKFPRVMKAMGHSAEDVSRATDKLSNGIDGLPTTLDEVVSTAQQLTSITKDLNKSTDLTLSLNNAFLASGSSSADASRGLQQFTQMLSSGKVDLQSWKTLQETMPYALQKTAESFGFAGASAQRDFYSALQTGQITFDQFSNKLIELNGGVGGFAEMAKENSKGIATSFGNLRNAVAKGLANMLKAFDELSKATTGKSIAENIDSMKVVVNSGFKLMTATVKASTPVFKFFFDAVKLGFDIIKPLSPLLIGLAAAFAAQRVVATATALIQGYTVGVQIMNAAISLSTTGQMANAAAFLYNQGVLKVSTLVYGLLTGQITLMSAAQLAGAAATGVWTAAVTAFNAAWLANPIGLVIVAITGLIAAGAALYAWLNKDSEETKKLKSEQEELTKKTDNLTDAIKQNAQARKQAIENTDKESVSYKKLADEVVNLASKEMKTAAEKKNLQKKIETLNGAMEGLNLAYDKNTGSLSHNTAQLYARIDAMEAESKWQATQEGLIAIERERVDISKQLTEISKQKKEVSEAQDISDRQRVQLLSELNGKETELKTALQNNQAEYAKTTAAQNAAAEAMAAAAESGATRQVIAYESMSQAQQSAIDSMRQRFQELKESTTNAFDAIEQKTAISAEQMTANLEANTAAVDQWSANLVILAQRGLNEGLIAQLEAAGPTVAAQTQALVDASDAELQNLNTAFENAGTHTKDSFNRSMEALGIEVPESIKGMVTNIQSGLQAELANADFSEFGHQVSNGFAEGINASSPKGADAARKMAEISKKAFQEEMGIHSPSRVFTEYGGHITSGLANGIANGSGAPVAKVANIAKNIKTPFNGIKSAFRSFGSSASEGVAEGINSNAHLAYAAANRLAAGVKATMSSALKINSPSKVLRDTVGRAIPEGVAVGIDKNADYVHDAVLRLKNSMITDIKPEIAFGINKDLESKLSVKQVARQEVSEKIELVMGKSNNLVDKALDTIDKLASRPTEMRFDDDTLVAKTVDKYQERIRWNEENNNRAWGIVNV